MNRLLLIDGQPLIYRSFYGGGDDAGFRHDGLPTGAVSGFLSRLWDLLRDDMKDHRFSHCAMVFDPPGRNWRHDVSKSYKANREEKPLDLVVQLDISKRIVPNMGVNVVEMAGYEADDLIATYAGINDRAGGETVIVTSDKDLYGLVKQGTVIYSPMTRAWVDERAVEHKFGVKPRLVREVQAITGDAVDNIIGIPGVGTITAAGLIKQFGSLEGFLSDWRSAKNRKLLSLLKHGRDATLHDLMPSMVDQLRTNYELVRLDDMVPVRVPLKDLVVRKVDAPAVLSQLRALDLFSFAKRIAFHYYLRADAAEPCAEMLSFAEEMQEWRGA